MSNNRGKLERRARLVLRDGSLPEHFTLSELSKADQRFEVGGEFYGVRIAALQYVVKHGWYSYDEDAERYTHLERDIPARVVGHQDLPSDGEQGAAVEDNSTPRHWSRLTKLRGLWRVRPRQTFDTKDEEVIRALGFTDHNTAEGFVRHRAREGWFLRDAEHRFTWLRDPTHVTIDTISYLTELPTLMRVDVPSTPAVDMAPRRLRRKKTGSVSDDAGAAHTYTSVLQLIQQGIAELQAELGTAMQHEADARARRTELERRIGCLRAAKELYDRYVAQPSEVRDIFRHLMAQQEGQGGEQSLPLAEAV